LQRHRHTLADAPARVGREGAQDSYWGVVARSVLSEAGCCLAAESKDGPKQPPSCAGDCFVLKAAGAIAETAPRNDVPNPTTPQNARKHAGVFSGATSGPRAAQRRNCASSPTSAAARASSRLPRGPGRLEWARRYASHSAVGRSRNAAR
jgi:hypothetical protein